MAHAFQRISGFKRVISCGRCKQRTTVARDEERYCKTCQEAMWGNKTPKTPKVEKKEHIIK